MFFERTSFERDHRNCFNERTRGFLPLNPFLEIFSELHFSKAACCAQVLSALANVNIKCKRMS
jgi:hypothetical protein